jgi:hypothetical protein
MDIYECHLEGDGYSMERGVKMLITMLPPKLKRKYSTIMKRYEKGEKRYYAKLLREGYTEKTLLYGLNKWMLRRLEKIMEELISDCHRLGYFISAPISPIGGAEKNIKREAEMK